MGGWGYERGELLDVGIFYCNWGVGYFGGLMGGGAGMKNFPCGGCVRGGFGNKEMVGRRILVLCGGDNNEVSWRWGMGRWVGLAWAASNVGGLDLRIRDGYVGAVCEVSGEQNFCCSESSLPDSVVQDRSGPGQVGCS